LRKQKRKVAKDYRCIGILLNYCLTDCNQCWFATEKKEPTLVRIDTFNKVQEMRLAVPDDDDAPIEYRRANTR
jgi:hypothetical protein